MTGPTCPVPRPPSRVSRALWPAVLVSMAAAVSPLWPPLVIGDVVAPGWQIFLVLAVAAFVLVNRAAARTTRRAHGEVALALVLVVPAMTAGLNAISVKDHLLPCIGPDGCRVVVREWSFLVTGGGSVGTVDTLDGFAPTQWRYETDDGGEPVAEGYSSLTWSPEGPLLSVSETITPGPPDRLRC